jgi:hypothetical protein
MTEKEKEIKKFMELFKISRAEAEQLWEDDQNDFIGEDGEEMTRKAKEIKRYENMGCKMNDNINSCNGMLAVDGWIYPMDRFWQSSSYAELRGSTRHYAVDLAVG